MMQIIVRRWCPCPVLKSRGRRHKTKHSFVLFGVFVLFHHACFVVLFLSLKQQKHPSYYHQHRRNFWNVQAASSSTASPSSSRRKPYSKSSNIPSTPSSSLSSASATEPILTTIAKEKEQASSISHRPFTVQNVKRFVNTRCNGLMQNIIVPVVPSGQTNTYNVTSTSFEAKRGANDVSLQTSIQKEENSDSDNKHGYGTWIYEGQLVNPFTGEQICEVEGIELTRHFGDVFWDKTEGKRSSQDIDSQPSQQKMLNALNGLQVHKLLSRSLLRHNQGLRRNELKVSETSTKKQIGMSSKSDDIAKPDEEREEEDWEYASTMFSRKLFCYRDPNQRNRLLQTYQKTPGVGKVRTLRPSEVISCYDSATTFVVRHDGKEMVVITEFPNRNCVIAQARDSIKPPTATAVATLSTSNNDAQDNTSSERTQQEASNDDGKKSFEFTTYGRLKSIDTANSSSSKHSTIKFPPLIYPSKGAANKKKKKPPRVTWVQFGADSRKVVNERYGARESYSFLGIESLNSSSSLMKRPYAMHTNISKISSKTSVKSIRTTLADSLTNARSLLGLKRNTANGTIGSSTGAPSSTVVPTVKYTRYGECPPWYGPNQMCTLELVGRRVDSIKEAPPLIASVARHAIGSSDFAALHNKSIPLSNEGEEEGGHLCGEDFNKPNSRDTLLHWFRKQNSIHLNEDYAPLFGTMNKDYSLSFHSIKRVFGKAFSKANDKKS